jgi:hypothetical protein
MVDYIHSSDTPMLDEARVYVLSEIRETGSTIQGAQASFSDTCVWTWLQSVIQIRIVILILLVWLHVIIAGLPSRLLTDVRAELHIKGLHILGCAIT